MVTHAPHRKGALQRLLCMGDLKDPRLMYLKAGLFLLAGCGAVAGILVEFPSVRLAALLAIALWSF